MVRTVILQGGDLIAFSTRSEEHHVPHTERNAAMQKMTTTCSENRVAASLESNQSNRLSRENGVPDNGKALIRCVRAAQNQSRIRVRANTRINLQLTSVLKFKSTTENVLTFLRPSHHHTVCGFPDKKVSSIHSSKFGSLPSAGEWLLVPNTQTTGPALEEIGPLKDSDSADLISTARVPPISNHPRGKRRLGFISPRAGQPKACCSSWSERHLMTIYGGVPSRKSRKRRRCTPSRLA